MRFLEGWPVPGNMVLDGLGQDMVSLIKDWPVPGNVVLDGLGQDMVSLIKDWIARCEVSGRMASSRKYGLGWSGPGYG